MILQGGLSKSEDGAAPSAIRNIFLRWVCTCAEGDAVPQLRSRYTNNIHALARTRHSAFHCKSCVCPGYCVTGFLLPSTGAGTNARHVSTTRVLLLRRWQERAHLRVNLENTCTQYSSFALVCGLEYTCNVYFLQTMPVSSF